MKYKSLFLILFLSLASNVFSKASQKLEEIVWVEDTKDFDEKGYVIDSFVDSNDNKFIVFKSLDGIKYNIDIKTILLRYYFKHGKLVLEHK